jgi:hypothetical protein
MIFVFKERFGQPLEKNCVGARPMEDYPRWHVFTVGVQHDGSKQEARIPTHDSLGVMSLFSGPGALLACLMIATMTSMHAGLQDADLQSY